MSLCLEFQIINQDQINVLKALIQQSAKLGMGVGPSNLLFSNYKETHILIHEL